MFLLVKFKTQYTLNIVKFERATSVLETQLGEISYIQSLVVKFELTVTDRKLTGRTMRL